MKRYLSIVFVISCCLLKAQTITGVCPDFKNKEVNLIGFNGTAEIELAQSKADNMGNFKLVYPTVYVGAALIRVKDIINFIVLLDRNNFNVTLKDIKNPNTLSFNNSETNNAVSKGMDLYALMERKTAGLKFLLPLYSEDYDKKEWLTNEILEVEQSFDKFLNNLPANNYAKPYLKYRKLLNEMLAAVKDETSDKHKIEEAFKKIDFDDPALWHSGLLADILMTYYKLMESYKDESVYNIQSIQGTEAWLTALSSNPTKWQGVSAFVFDFCEKYNKQSISEYIAKKVLNQYGCQIEGNLASRFEQYRKMAIGNSAPPFKFKNPDIAMQSLTDVQSKFKLIVFGSSWCEECQKEIPLLKGYADFFKKNYDAVIILNSLDTNQEDFAKLKNDNKEILMSCDFKKWDGENVKNYCVFATPTFYILNEDNKIVAKPLNAVDSAAWFYKNSTDYK